MKKKTKQQYPVGWNEERVRKLAEHYDNQTDDEAVAEIEAALTAENQTMMSVPTELVPEILKLINKKTARPGNGSNGSTARKSRGRLTSR